MTDLLFEASHLSKRHGAQAVVGGLTFALAPGESRGVAMICLSGISFPRDPLPALTRKRFPA